MSGRVNRRSEILAVELRANTAVDDDTVLEYYLFHFGRAMRNSANHRSNLAWHLIQYATMRDELVFASSLDFNAFETVRGIPTNGNILDLTNMNLVPRSEGMRFMLTDLGWEIPEIDPSLLSQPATPEARFMDDAIRYRWGVDLLRRIAAALVMTSKDIPIIAPHPSALNGGTDTGKSTLLGCVAAAFPGMVNVVEHADNLHPKSSNFSQHTTPLTEQLIHFYDEVDKTQGIRAGLINSLTPDNLTIEKKGLDPVKRRRIGTPFFVVGGIPPIDGTAQGITSRLPAVYELQTIEILYARGRKVLMQPSALAYLRAWIVYEANTIIEEEKTRDEQISEFIITDAAREASRRMIENMKPLINELFEDNFVAGAETDFVSYTNIENTLKGAGLPHRESIDPNKIKSMVLTLNPNAVRKTRKINGDRKRGYAGIRLLNDSV